MLDSTSWLKLYIYIYMVPKSIVQLFDFSLSQRSLQLGPKVLGKHTAIIPSTIQTTHTETIKNQRQNRQTQNVYPNKSYIYIYIQYSICQLVFWVLKNYSLRFIYFEAIKLSKNKSFNILVGLNLLNWIIMDEYLNSLILNGLLYFHALNYWLRWISLIVLKSIFCPFFRYKIFIV